MAEFIQKRLELISDECQQMQNSKLFNGKERSIMLKRKEYEYKIHAVSKNLQSFQEYIKFENSLLKYINNQKIAYKNLGSASIIEKNIIKRICFLYETALQRFPMQTDFLLLFLKFCKTVKQRNMANKAITRMVKLNPDKPEIWRIFASWYAYDCNNINEAMNLLFKGIEIHKNNTELYIEMIKILLHFCIEHEKQKTVDPELVYIKQIEEIIKNTFSNITDVYFYIEVLGILETNSFSESIQKIILDHMTDNYKEEELVWHTIAQRYYKGFFAGNDHLLQLKSQEKNMAKSQLMACFAAYDQGLETVPREKQRKMYELYLKFLFTLQKVDCDTATNTLRNTLEDCHQKRYLSEEHYLEWANFDKENGINIIKEGLSLLPKSVELLKTYLRLLILENDVAAVNEVFKEGVSVLKEKSLPLWLSFIQYHMDVSSENYVEEIYKEAIKQPKEVSNVIKPVYLDWVTGKKGITAAREIYLDMANQKPYCKNLHKLMAKAESQQTLCNFECWLKVHKLACEQFGKEDINVWIEYMEFYVIYNKGIDDLNIHVQEIYKQAECSLPENLFNEFLTRYNKLMESV